MKEKKKRRGRGRRWRSQDQASQGMELTLGLEIMDFSMNLVQKLLEYELLGFPLNFNFILISRVLLGKHSNSRFKGSLVEKP